MAPEFIHPTAICESETLGSGTRLWAFVHVLPGAIIGRDCNICDGVFIENDVIVGDRVTIKSGVQLWDGVRLGDDVFIGPNVTFSNDRFPRSRKRPPEFLATVVEHGASLGANATILPGINIGVGAMIGAGAVVTRSVPAHAIVVGNPARIRGYVDTRTPTPSTGLPATQSVSGSTIDGVELRSLPQFADLRGRLSVLSFGQDLPFAPRRCFLVHGVPSQEVRGAHAHRQCVQFLVCTHGAVSVHLDDGHQREEYRLESPDLGLLIPSMVWATQYRYSPDAVLLVLASHEYDADDYIRDYQDFLACRDIQ